MNGSNHLEESDSRDLHLCPVCLRKLHWSTGFNTVERYSKLQCVFQRLGLKDDAQWVKQRLTRIKEGD
jgi:archaemetzincin